MLKIIAMADDETFLIAGRLDRNIKNSPWPQLPIGSNGFHPVQYCWKDLIAGLEVPFEHKSPSEPIFGPEPNWSFEWM